MRKRVVVAGKVQDVFFRDSTLRQAEQAGVSGWVRNRPNGDVDAVFEGIGLHRPLTDPPADPPRLQRR